MKMDETLPSLTAPTSVIPALPAVGSTHDQLIAAWLAALTWEAEHLRRAAETVRTYRSAMEGPRGWLSFLRGNVIDRPTATDVYRFMAELRATMSPATCNRVLAAIRSCYRWMESQGLYDKAIGENVPPYRIPRTGARAAIGISEVAKLCAQAFPRRGNLGGLAKLRDEALMRVIFGTGVRLVSLERADVLDLVEHPGGLHLRHQPKQHTVKDTLVMIPPNAARAMHRYLDARAAAGVTAEALFIAVHPQLGSRLDRSSLRRIVYRYLDGAGLRQRTADGHLVEPRVWGPHMLRRSAAVHAVDVLGIEAGQTLMAHASIDQTRRAYASVKEYRLLQQLGTVMDLPEQL